MNRKKIEDGKRLCAAFLILFACVMFVGAAIDTISHQMLRNGLRRLDMKINDIVPLGKENTAEWLIDKIPVVIKDEKVMAELMKCGCNTWSEEELDAIYASVDLSLKDENTKPWLYSMASYSCHDETEYGSNVAKHN